CRRLGSRKATDGILLIAGRHIDEFHVVARWGVAAELVVTHRIHYKLLDREFDFASDDMMLWNAMSESLGGWSRGMPAWVGTQFPAQGSPLMVFEDSPGTKKPDGILLEDVRNERGHIIERKQEFPMPTIERGRLRVNSGIARPTQSSAFP